MLVTVTTSFLFKPLILTIFSTSPTRYLQLIKGLPLHWLATRRGSLMQQEVLELGLRLVHVS